MAEPDIRVVTEHLVEFALQDFRPNLGAIAPYVASAAAQGGRMPEGNALREADRLTANKLMQGFTAIDQGMVGYTVGAANIANKYEANEYQIIGNLNALMPNDPGLPPVAQEFRDDVAADQRTDQSLRRAI